MSLNKKDIQDKERGIVFAKEIVTKNPVFSLKEI
jgi:hypothetical protein